MKKFNIDNLVKQVIEESLQEKTDDLVGKLKSRMQEWNQDVNISNQPGDVVEYHDMESVPNPGGCKKIKEMIANGGKDVLNKLEEYCGKSEIGESLKGGQRKLDKNKNGKIDAEDFKMLRKKETKENKGVCSECGMNEELCECGSGYMEESEDFDFSFTDEIGEGNLFSGERAKAIEKGEKTFEVGGKSYPVKEGKEKWIQDTKMRKGALHKKLGIPEGEKLSVSKLNKIKKDLMKKGEGDKKLSAEDSKLLKQVNLALTLRDVKESKKDTLQLTESEMIDLIQKLVMEEKKAKGMAETEKVLSASKKENEAAIKAVTKKMKDYLKYGSEGEYETNPENFPMGNGQIKKMDAMKYTPSEAVDEYIDAFAYPGMTNLTFDEIKPDDERIDKYLKGDSTTGNAVKDKKGKALGNVVPSKTGDKFKTNFDENLYGAEQKNASYKRQSQPVDVSGNKTIKGPLNKGKKSSINKAQSVLNKVDESTNNKKNVLNEEFEKMKHLISYNKNTQ